MPLRKSKSPKDETKNKESKHDNKNKSFKEAEKKRFVNENWKKMAREYDERHVTCLVDSNLDDYYVDKMKFDENLPGHKKKRENRKTEKSFQENCSKEKTFRPEIYLGNKIIEDLTSKYKSQLLPLNTRSSKIEEKKKEEDSGPKKKEVTFLDDKLKNGFTNAGYVQSPPLNPVEKNPIKFDNGISNCGFVSSPINEDLRKRPKPIISPTDQFLAELSQNTFANPVFECSYDGVCNEGFVQSPEIDKNETSKLAGDFESMYEVQLDRDCSDAIADTVLGDHFEYPAIRGKPQRPDKIMLDRIPEILNNENIDSEMKWYDFVSKMKKKTNRKSSGSSEKENTGKIERKNQFLRRKSEEWLKENEKCLEEYKRFKRASNDERTLAEYCQLVEKELKKMEKERKVSPMEEVNQIFEYCLAAQQEKGKGLGDIKLRKSKRNFQRVGSVKLPKTKYGLHPECVDHGRRSNLDSRLSKSRNLIWKYGSTSSRFFYFKFFFMFVVFKVIVRRAF